MALVRAAGCEDPGSLNWLDVIWIGSAAACLTLGTLHLFIWVRGRRTWAHLVFAVVAAAAAGVAYGELAMMRAQTLPQLGIWLRWTQAPLFVLVAGIVVFLRLYFGTGRLWLAGAAVGTRLLALVLNFAGSPNISYRQLTAVRQIEILGQTVTVVEGVVNPWIWVARASSLLVLAFVVDASIAYWRRADPDTRRRAWTVGGSLAFFSVAAATHAALVQHAVIESPFAVSLFFLVAVGAVGSELTNDVVRAAAIARRLHESEQQMALAMEAAQSGVWVWDPGADRVSLSDRTRRLFDLQPSDEPTLGQLLSRVHPEDREPLLRALEQAMAGEGDLQADCRVAGSGGTVRWVANRGRRDAEVGSAAARLRVVSSDITARKRAEEQLAESEREARQSRNEITHLSRVALASELSGSLAHELNQPLGAILSNAQAIRRLLAREQVDLAEIRSIVDDIVSDDQRAGEIIQRVRQMLRKGESQWEDLDVADIVRQGLSLVRRDLAERQITLDEHCGTVLPLVRGDPTQLQQVVLNLVMNAMDAMEDMTSAPRNLRVRTERLDGAEIRVSVSDNGPGVPPSMLEEIFQPFVTTKQRGIGMGLAMCHSIVTAHGGRLWAENNAGGGATVQFTLPVPAAADG